MIAVKFFLSAFALALAIIAIVLFLCLMAREFAIDRRIRKSAKGRLLDEQPIAREWSLKDPPAWERLPPSKTLRLRAGLRGMGE